MFSKLQSIAVLASSAQAVETLYPAVTVAADKAKTFTAMSAMAGAAGETIAEASSCGLCIMSGGVFYATKGTDYTASESASALAGKCCAPGKISDAAWCNQADVSAGKLSTAWAQPELALANCPNVKASCAGEPVIDLDKITAPATTETRTAGGTGVTFNQKEVCSYIVSSACGAPTVDFTSNENKEATKTNAFVETMWDVSYLEYSLVTDSTLTEEKLEISNKMAVSKKTDLLGGDMWAVNWYDKEGAVQVAPAETFAKWIGISNTAYDKYTTDTTSQTYKDAIDTWNFYARQVSWLKEWVAANVGKTAPDATILKKYTDKMVDGVADAAGVKAKLAPEMPVVPPMPASYNGPVMKPKDTKDADRKNMFELIGGFGRPSVGKLPVADANGSAHMFGVHGTGNLATNADADIKKAPNAVSMVYPAQATDTAKCGKSTLVVTVRGTKAQTTAGSTLTLAFQKETFDSTLLTLKAKPAKTALVPKDREGAQYLAAGLASAVFVAASLY